MSGSLEDRIVWITGAASGIGRATARLLAAEGAVVTVTDRDGAGLEETAATIRTAGGSAFAETLDVTDASRIAAVALSIERQHGRLDILVNNAGLNIPDRAWARYDHAQWQQVLRINVEGTMACTAAVLPIMRRQGGGLVVNLASWVSRYPASAAGVVYGASKSAILSLSTSINMEEAENGIRACAICPAEVATPFMDRRPKPATPEEKDRMLRPEDIAEAILFVARYPARVCVNEIVISPGLNPAYVRR